MLCRILYITGSLRLIFDDVISIFALNTFSPSLYIPFFILQFSLTASAETAEARDGVLGLSVAYLFVTGLLVWHLFGLGKRLQRVQIAIRMIPNPESEWMWLRKCLHGSPQRRGMDDEDAHSVELTIPCASCGSIELLAHTMMCASCVKERIVLARIPETMQYMQCQGCSHIETPRQGWQAMEEETLWSHLIETHLELDTDVTNPVIGWEVTPLDNRNHRINITISAHFGPFPL